MVYIAHAWYRSQEFGFYQLNYGKVLSLRLERNSNFIKLINISLKISNLYNYITEHKIPLQNTNLNCIEHL